MLPGRKYTPWDLATIAWRKRWFIIVPAIVCSFAALVISSRLEDRYQSDTLIQVVPQRVPDAYVRSTVTMRADERLEAISQQVMSRTLLERIVRELDLYPEQRATLPLEDVIDAMRPDIDVELVWGKNQVADAFHVRFTYTDPVIAAKVTERLGSLFVDQNASDRGALAEATNRFLQSQLTEARGRLESQEAKLERFRERHAGKLPSQMQFNMQAIQAAQLQLQGLAESLARDRDRKLMLERLYTDAQAEPLPLPPAPAAAATPDPAATTADPVQQLEQARATLARLRMRLTPEHPDIVRAQRTIRDLEATVAAAAAEPSTATPPVPEVVSPHEIARRTRLREIRAELESLERQIAFKESEEQRQRAEVAEYQQRIEAVPGIESEWSVLTRDYDTLQEAYRKLLSKSEDSKVAADLERRQIGEQFRVLDPARVPVRPLAPVRLRTNLIGLAAGLLLGVGLVALMEIRDSSFRRKGDVVATLALPVLATVPMIVGVAEVRRRTRVRAALAAGIAVGVVAGGYVFWSLQLWRHVV